MEDKKGVGLKREGVGVLQVALDLLLSSAAGGGGGPGGGLHA